MIDHFKYFEQQKYVQKFVHYKDRHLILLDIAQNLHMNGLLLHLALAQARIQGNAVSEAQAQGTRGETLPFFLRFAFFVSGPRVSGRYSPGQAGAACAAWAQSAGCAGPGLQTGDRLARAACSDQPRLQTSPRPALSPGNTGLSGAHRPAPVSAVCSHLHQSCRELPALQHAE